MNNARRGVWWQMLFVFAIALVLPVARATDDGASPYALVDCLIPPQLIKQGLNSVRFTPSRLIRTSSRQCARQGGAQKAGIEAWEQLAASGNSEAQVYLGEMYENGTGGVTKNISKAVELYERSANSGNARAASNLALIYANGRSGVKADDAKARQFVRQSFPSTIDTRNIVVVPAVGTAPPNTETSSSLPDVLQSFQFGNFHALLIGNSDYRNMPKLQSPLVEIDAVGNALEARGFQVRKIRNGTKDQILQALDDLNQTLKPEDNLLVYYTGHGAQSESGQGYWLPVDGEGVQSTSRFRTRLWVSTSEVRDLLSVLPSRHVLVVSDSCYAGRFLQFRGSLSSVSPTFPSQRYLEMFATIYAARSRTAMTSGGLAPVIEPASGMSIFARAFIEYIESTRAPFPSVNLFVALREKVMEGSLRLGFPQEPQWGYIDGSGHESGDFYFRKR